MRRAVAILIALSAVQLAAGQNVAGQRVSVAFWNVENLFDTIPSPFYDDREFTPDGANRWNTERYRAKIESLAAVLDELNADIVGLAEVENETVVRDLVTALRTDYNYIHRTSGDGRGIDQALLYKGDKFFPDEDPGSPGSPDIPGTPGTPAVRLLDSGMGREFLHIRGELLGEPIHLIVTHMASNLNPLAMRRRNLAALRTALENILTDDPAAAIITMGDMNATPRDRIVRQTLGPLASPWDMMYTPHGEPHNRRQGSYSYRGRWLLYDWMMVSPAISRGTTLRIAGAGIHARAHQTIETTGNPPRPRRTFYGGEWEGGPSDHFPVWITVVK